MKPLIKPEEGRSNQQSSITNRDAVKNKQNSIQAVKQSFVASQLDQMLLQNNVMTPIQINPKSIETQVVNLTKPTPGLKEIIQVEEINCQSPTQIMPNKSSPPRQNLSKPDLGWNLEMAAQASRQVSRSQQNHRRQNSSRRRVLEVLDLGGQICCVSFIMDTLLTLFLYTRKQFIFTGIVAKAQLLVLELIPVFWVHTIPEAKNLMLRETRELFRRNCDIL